MRKGRLLTGIFAVVLVVMLLGVLAIACTTTTTVTAPGSAGATTTVTAPGAGATTTVTKTNTVTTTGTAAAKTFDWKYAGWGTPTDEMEVTAEIWGNKVMELSGGRIKITYYHGQALGQQLDQPSMLQGGVCQVSELPDVAQFPLLEISDLPYVGANSVVAMDAYYNAYSKSLFDQELAPFKPLVFMTTDPTFLMTSKKSVTTIDQLVGMKIRGRPGTLADIVTALGATTVAMSAADLYMSLNTGILDGTMTTAQFAIPNKIPEVAKYVTWTPICTGVMPLAMSKPVYDQLPDDLKLVINEASDYTRYQFVNKYGYTNNEIIKHLQDAGVQVTILSADQQAIWQQKTQPIVDKWLQNAQSKGLGNQAQQLLDIFNRNNQLTK